MRIRLYLIQEDGTSKALPRTDEELRIYLVGSDVAERIPAVPSARRSAGRTPLIGPIPARGLASRSFPAA